MFTYSDNPRASEAQVGGAHTGHTKNVVRLVELLKQFSIRCPTYEAHHAACLGRSSSC